MKTLLLDIDGVLLLREKYFSEHLSEDYHIPLEDIMPFFKTVMSDCLIGEKDLKEELESGWLQKWNWQGTVDDLLRYWFTKESRINHELLDKLDEIKTPKYLATDNEKYKCEYIWNELTFKDHFTQLFASSNIYIRKSNPEFYHTVAEKIGIPTSELIFFDDDMVNVTAAHEAGVESYFYTTNEDLLKKIA
jgi:putative hydrolase of the HAD superfamily